MTHPGPDPFAKSIIDFWDDMGALDQDEALQLYAEASAMTPVSSPSGRRAEAPSGASAPSRPEPRRLAPNNPPAEARRIAMAAGSLEDLREAIGRFDGCPLKQAARNTVVFDGVTDAPVMIVGEAPGGDEDAVGKPFVGRAGKLLDRMLKTVGLTRAENVYITNCIYWRPPGNRDPSPAEMLACAPFLARQIELKAPKLLLTVGKFATQALLGVEDGIMRLRGRRMWFKPESGGAVPCIPILHPAYLLRQPRDKAKAWDDLLAIAALCDELEIKRGPGL